MPCFRTSTRLIAPSGLFLLSLLSAAAASALPVTLFADPKAVSGFAPRDVAAAIQQGAAQPIPVDGLIGGQPFFSVTTPNGIPGVKGKNRRSPSRGTSTWTLRIAEETPAELRDDFYLVVLGHDRHDPMKYKSKKVGLEITTSLPWLLVENEDAPGMTHLAFSLGDLEAGGVYEIPIEYRVAGKLKKRHGEYVFPRYSIAYLSAPLVLPEPGSLALLVGALAASWLVRKRSR